MKFKVGDFVKLHAREIGIVEWVENKCMDIKEEDGYLGIGILTHTRGFAAPVKVDDCKKSSLDEVIKYYKKEINRLHDIAKSKQCNEQKLKRLEIENEQLKKLLKMYI